MRGTMQLQVEIIFIFSNCFLFSVLSVQVQMYLLIATKAINANKTMLFTFIVSLKPSV
jgi:hypothetical protein